MCIEYELPPVTAPLAPPDYWTLKEFAHVVRLSDKSIYRLLEQDTSFPRMRIGGSVRIPRERASQWLADRTKGDG